MKQKRPFTDRLQDRLWSMQVLRQAIDLPLYKIKKSAPDSISGTMLWPRVCAALADGEISSRHFRRLRAVMDVVETLGPCDGRHHSRRIRKCGMAHWLEDQRIKSVSEWGTPLTWPSFLLEIPQALAPTSLRYLSHALWLRERGFLKQHARVIEVGVGYGGLAAMNAIISQTRTTLVDLPEVELAAMKMLAENGLANNASSSSATGDDGSKFDCFVSNYAFTELSSNLQGDLIDNYIVRSRHGMIVSNAAVFASEIGGMDNEKLVAALRSHSLDAVVSTSDDLLSPSDRAFGIVLISW